MVPRELRSKYEKRGRYTKMDGKMSSTQYFKTVPETKVEVGQVMKEVYKALSEKGYNPVNQIVGYIMSGDPTYITSYKNARSLIMKVERDELIEEALTYYINNRLR
jgi:Uncharacterized protein conserved in bacteria